MSSTLTPHSSLHALASPRPHNTLAPHIPTLFAAAVRDSSERFRDQALALFEEWLRLMASFPGAAQAAAQHPGATTASDSDRAALANYLKVCGRGFGEGGLGKEVGVQGWLVLGRKGCRV